MKTKPSKLFLAIKTASLLGATTLLSHQAMAQSDSKDIAKVEEVVVTGSAIRNENLTSALPIEVLSELQIAQTGATSVADLVATLPSMQNFTVSADSVGGDGGGIQTANLRSLGEQYTLSLLDGRRMAPADSGSLIDISNIPVGLIKSVQVLKDGAGALYGSDAIAGVVNFILKDEVEESTFRARFDRPQEDGGEAINIDFTTGFGSLSEDGYAVVFSYSHSEKEQLKASQRDFADSGIINLTHPDTGDNVVFFNGSSNSIPGNATVSYTYMTNNGDIIGDDEGEKVGVKAFSPYGSQNGCPSQTFALGSICSFDYTSTIEITPETERDTYYLGGKLNFTDNLMGFSRLVYSNHETIARTAPYPTGAISFPLNDDDNPSALAFVQEQVLSRFDLTPGAPNFQLTEADIEALNLDDEGKLKAEGDRFQRIVAATDVTGQWRALPFGNRTNSYDIQSINFTSGLEGSSGNINYDGAYTYSVTDSTETLVDGWLLEAPFVSAIQAGSVNIFADQSSFDPAQVDAIDGAVYRGWSDRAKITQHVTDAKMSFPITALAGGDIMMAIGGDYRSTNYDRSVSDVNAQAALLFTSADTPYDFTRDQFGVFSETVLPLTDTLQTTFSVRYDNIGAVEDNTSGDINESVDKVTYKISSMWEAMDSLSLRASYGTGIKAPSMREIGEPLSEFGVTSGTYLCPFASSDPLARFCNPAGDSQYTIFRRGTAELQPETSTQYSFGFIFQTDYDLSLTVDYWNIEINDLVQRLTEGQIFGDPSLHRDLFTTKFNTSAKREELAIIQDAVNVGWKIARGVDYSIEHTMDFSLGNFTTRLNGTYMIKNESSLTGSSLGRFGSDDEVVFRNKARLDFILSQNNFTHNIGINFQSGYHDDEASVTVVNEDGSFGNRLPIQLNIPTQTRVDFRSTYAALNGDLNLTLGIKNVFDKEPPLSLQDGGSGHQVGWDPRFYDAYGRTLYLESQYAF